MLKTYLTSAVFGAVYGTLLGSANVDNTMLLILLALFALYGGVMWGIGYKTGDDNAKKY